MSKPAATNAATKPKTRSPSPLFAAVVSKFPNKKSNVKRPDPVGQHMRGISIEQTTTTSSSTPKQSPTSIKKNNSFETIDTADVIGGPSISSMTCGAAGAAVVSTKKNEELGNNNNGSSSTPMLDDNTVPSIKRDTNNLSLIQETAELDHHDDDGQYNHIIEPYAIRHDEIVTALIDDALQQSSHRNDGENDEGDSSSPLDISITNTATSKEQQKQQPSSSSSSAAANNIDNSNREDNSGGDPKKPRSPYRMKRNISQALANHSPVKIRKRSNDNDKKQQSKLKSSFTRMSSSSSNNNNNRDRATNHRPIEEFLHPDCILQKEKGTDSCTTTKQQISSKLGFCSMINSNYNNDNETPSAVGREETLIKLQNKLSMLGDIESGKYGKAAEMLRSDAVGFTIKGNTTISSITDLSKLSQKKRPSISKVETRSILTLRMGFVSMSYGILLQWDCTTRLVELIVLRKMCRDDFLKGKGSGNNDTTSSAVTQSKSNKMELQLSSSAASPSSSKTPKKIHKRSESEMSSYGVEVNPGKPAAEQEHHHGKFTFPKLHFPAGLIPKFGGHHHHQPQSFLSVSVLSVKGLHNVCDHCRDPNSVGRMINGAQLGSFSKRKRKHPTIRPYIRFLLGKHEHSTKVTRFNDGNPRWSKHHHNSCLLPCPPDEIRWFAGREDLVVEVRNHWVKANSGGDSWFGGHHAPSSEADHPILAVVTVPLSSVNIEDGDANNFTEKEGTWKRRTHKDGASSTNITLPLRMSACTSAPMAIISLKITIKVPSKNDEEKNTGDVTIGVFDESIEIGPLTRLMETLGGSPAKAPQVDDNKKEHKAASRRKPSSPRKLKLRWSKQFDPQTKTWSSLTQSRRSPRNRSSKVSKSETKTGNAEENNNDGWFTFLKREDTRDVGNK